MMTLPPRAAAIPRFAILTGELRPLDAIRLPAFPGSELRGLLTQGLAQIGRVQDTDPPPFTITPAWLAPDAPPDQLVEIPPATPIPLRILWFGTDRDPAITVAAAFAAIGWQPWLGRGRRSTFTARIEVHIPAPTIAARLSARMTTLADAPTLRLTTITPLALRDHGEMRRDINEGRALLTSIRHRAHRLAEDFGALDHPPLTIDNGPLQVIEEAMTPMTWRRLGRGDRYLPIAAMTGTIRWRPPPPTALAALVVGEAIGAGRWTAFGAGRYRLAGEGASGEQTRAGQASGNVDGFNDGGG